MDNAIKSKLPIGIEDFAEIRTEGFYYVDKTAMITITCYKKSCRVALVRQEYTK